LEFASIGEIENWSEANTIDEYILGFFDVVVDAEHISRSQELNGNERQAVLKVVASFDELQAEFDKNKLWDKTSWDQFILSDHCQEVKKSAIHALVMLRSDQ